MQKKREYIAYEYNHAPVPGGGFVTGFVFHNRVKNILYARTDIGGVYRYDFENDKWWSLVDHVTTLEKWETYPLSIALDDNNPDYLYIVAGDWEKNYLLRSRDRGETFDYFRLPAGVHGNAPGRGTGERLVVDPVSSNKIYFGSQSEGLLLSEDYGETWQSLAVQPQGGKVEKDISFVWLDPRSGRDGSCKTIVVACSGEGNSPGKNIRASSLYISKDGGKTFKILPGQPQPPKEGEYPGFVGQRASFDGQYLYITMASALRSWAGWRGYACDVGGLHYGCVLRYHIDESGDIKDWSNITPNIAGIIELKEGIATSNSFGGICVFPDKKDWLICTSQCSLNGDSVMLSRDRGSSWEPILHGLEVGRMDFSTVPYMDPKYNGGGNIIHWLSDIKIDPFNSNRAVFNTGTGIFMTENLLEAARGQEVVWRPSCKGLEETVHLNVYSPPAGDIKLIDIIGDLGGFAFADLNKAAGNSFDDQDGNRYITCLNADFPDSNPYHVVVTARGNWTGRTTGGLIWSEDQCKTWTRLPDPVGITSRIDDLISEIRKPNTNSGWVAISADGENLVWSVGQGDRLPINAVVYTNDLGQTWQRVRIYDLKGELVENEIDTLKVLSDRVDPAVFYGFGDESKFYISTDKGKSFVQLKACPDFPLLELGGMDGRMPAEIRAESGKTGIVWISTGEKGLWKVEFNKQEKRASFNRVSAEGDHIFRQGMGKEAAGSQVKTLYVNGIIDGEYGFYRSFDEGKTWQRINNEKQMFGDIRTICGDPRCFGRFYIGTGTRGVLWGQPLE